MSCTTGTIWLRVAQDVLHNSNVLEEASLGGEGSRSATVWQGEVYRSETVQQGPKDRRPESSIAV